MVSPPLARLARDDIDHEAAADAAVGAGRLHAAGDPRRRVLRGERPRRTRRHALAGRGAHRGGQRAVAEDADLGRVTAAEEGDRADLLDLVAGDRAAPAEDARLAVEHEERLGRVDVEAVEGREARLAQGVAGRPPPPPPPDRPPPPPGEAHAAEGEGHPAPPPPARGARRRARAPPPP